MGIITAVITHGQAWSAPSDCVVNIVGSVSANGLTIDGVNYTGSAESLLCITGEPIKVGGVVRVSIGTVRVAGFTV